ncbi:MAG TPA: ROK family protein [Victivallales bacterium]|nr:ROK family protein [Victivallales bacterium]
MGIYIGLDIGGTKLMAAGYDEKFNELDRVKYPTPKGLDEGIDLLHKMISQISNNNKIMGIGAAIGGPLDVIKGIVSPLHQPEWRDIPLKDIMEERWNAPFFVDVDTNAAALGEYHIGGYKEKYFLYITISTGMGGGYLVDGKIYEGKCHPEVGHQTVNYRCKHPENINCECGVVDCLESIVSGNGIRRIYGKPAEQLNAEEWDEVAYNLGQGLRNIAAILAPELIVLGGGVAVGGGKGFLDKVKEYMRSHVQLVQAPDVQLSCHGYDTALIGAAYIAKGNCI